MNLRDRMRRWWSPAQWNDDHPREAKESNERAARKKHHGVMYGGMNDGMNELQPHMPRNADRDFKKPR